ncbi:MAG TPA: hypothetical protein VKR30_01275 [Candidatus Limnocylindrales bacterium]|nr:hypothetical protein [Candidatus Limnocylindrales bacterium]
MSTNSVASSARLVTLRAGDTEAIVDLDHGARLASLRIGDRELIIGPPAPADGSIRWGSFLMAPWPGRLAEGHLRWRGRTWRLRRNHGRHSIHGLTFDAPWTCLRADATELEATVELEPLGWPFAGRVGQRLGLEPSGLRLEAAIEADEPMPAALGWHPWFRRGWSDVRVRLDAAEVLVLRDMIPTGARAAVHGRTDLRAGPALGRRRLDDVYVRPRGSAAIAWPDLDVSIEPGGSITTIVVHTPPGSLCVEPQTAWPNALGTTYGSAGADAATLGPGDRLDMSIRVRWTPRPQGPAPVEGPAAGAW